MQDVRLVAGVNGHVVQCPLAQAECPTCGEFHTLRSVVARLEKSLQHLADKVIRPNPVSTRFQPAFNPLSTRFQPASPFKPHPSR